MMSDLSAEQMLSDEQINTQIAYAARLVVSARNGVVITGAGISTPSGIPDFRSRDSGLWEKHNPMEVASLSAFRHHPERFFAWVRPLLANILAAEPNPAHYAIAEMQKAGHFSAIVTQNIDGLHQKAGSSNVLEVHGSLETATCTMCYRTYRSEQFIPKFLETGEIPRCPHCGGILKPNVVLFGEALPWEVWQKAQEAVLAADLVLVAGSSLEVMPVARLPVEAAMRGAPVIIVNKTPTYMDVRADVVLRGDVAEILPRIAEAARRALSAEH